MHKLTEMEAQRVMAVMEDALDKLEHISFVPAAPSSDVLDALADEQGTRPVWTCVQAQWHAEQSAAQAGALGPSRWHAMPHSGIDGGADPGRRGDHLDEVGQATRALCRSLRRHPRGAEVLRGLSLKRPRSPRVLALNGYVEELSAMAFRRLSTTVEEEAASRNLLRDLTERERLAEDERDMLTARLAATRADKDRESGALQALLAKAGAELREVTQANALEAESTQRRAEEAIGKGKEEHQRKVKALLERRERLLKEIADTAEAHREEEAASRRRKTKAEAELAAAVARFDGDMATTTEEIARLTACLEAEAAE
ncbi:unnamed protein product, partial [Phaeothamnion confervicola]